ncbi:MAG: hypothetical protein ACYS7Y_32215 [Planctomycetota bacterium]|jgi:hypothetical protein
MLNRAALRKAREIIEVNLKQHRTPARADVDQLVDGYPMEHAIRVLKNLEALFPGEDWTDGGGV